MATEQNQDTVPAQPATPNSHQDDNAQLEALWNVMDDPAKAKAVMNGATAAEVGATPTETRQHSVSYENPNEGAFHVHDGVVIPAVVEKAPEAPQEPQEAAPEGEATPEEGEPAEASAEPAEAAQEPSGDAKPQPKDDKRPYVKKSQTVRDVQKHLEELNPQTRATVNRLLKEHETERKRREELEHRIKSDEGRVAAYQREAAEAKARLALTGNQPAPAQQNPPGRVPNAATSPTAPKPKIAESERFKRLAENDPELAQLLLDGYSATENSLRQEYESRISKVREDVQEAESIRYKQHQSEIIKAHRPDVETTVSSEHFKEFIGTATPGIRAMFGSEEADDALALLNLYDQWKAFRYPDTVPARTTAPAAPRAPVAAPTAPVPNRADAVQQARTQRLATAAPANVQGAQTITSNDRFPDDPNAQLEWMWNRIKH